MRTSVKLITVVLYIIFILLALSSFSITVSNMEEECSWCTADVYLDEEEKLPCGDYDPVCGDFGKYWLLTVGHVVAIVVITMLFYIFTGERKS